MPKPIFGRRLPGDWAWKEAIRAYDEDHLEAAYEMTLALGMGADGGRGIFFRRIEAEYVTRQKAVQEPVNEWLTLEYISSEIPSSAVVIAGVLRACDEIARRLNWTHGPKVLIAVIADEADAPWMPGRYG